MEPAEVRLKELQARVRNGTKDCGVRLGDGRTRLNVRKLVCRSAAANAAIVNADQGLPWWISVIRLLFFRTPSCESRWYRGDLGGYSRIRAFDPTSSHNHPTSRP